MTTPEELRQDASVCEHATAALRELLTAWDGDDEVRFLAALLKARKLLQMSEEHDEP